MATIITRKLKNKDKVYYIVFKAYTKNGYKQIWKYAGKSKEQAKRIKAEIENKLLKANYGMAEYEPIPFSKYIDENFIPSKIYGKTLRENTKKMYLNACQNLKCYFKDKFLNTIITDDLVKYKNLRSQETGNRSVNIELLTIRQVLEYAYINKHIQYNPYIHKIIGKLPEIENTRYLNEDEEKILMANASLWARYVIFIVLQTGFRHNELSNFLFSDIDYQTNFIKVRAEVSKNKKERHIPISSNLKTVLLFLQNNWIDPKINIIIERKSCQKKYVFCNENGNRIQSFKKTISNTAKKAGLNDVTVLKSEILSKIPGLKTRLAEFFINQDSENLKCKPNIKNLIKSSNLSENEKNNFLVISRQLHNVSMHTLRKTFGSHLVQANVPLQVVSKILGHSNTMVTEKHYAFLANKNLQEAVDKLKDDSFGRYRLDGILKMVKMEPGIGFEPTTR